MKKSKLKEKTLVCIYKGFDYNQSRLIKMILDKEKIKYNIKNELGAFMPTGAKNMELFVEEDKLEECIKILNNELDMR